MLQKLKCLSCKKTLYCNGYCNLWVCHYFNLTEAYFALLGVAHNIACLLYPPKSTIINLMLPTEISTDHIQAVDLPYVPYNIVALPQKRLHRLNISV